MKTCRVRVISYKLLVISLVILGLIPCMLSFNQLGMQGINPLITLIKPVFAQTITIDSGVSLISPTNTTIYFTTFEKTLETGETNKYYNVGGATLQRHSRGGLEKLYYLFPDHLSSTKLVIDKDKTETNYLSYYPYGNLKTTGVVPPSVTNLYTNQKKDSETNLYYYHARYYDPTTAHFLSADPPAGGQGPNRYSYVANNPVMKNDPSGNQGAVSGLFPQWYLETMGNVSFPSPVFSNFTETIESLDQMVSLWQSDLSVGYKLLGSVDVFAGNSLSNTTFSVLAADPFRGGTLALNSGASVGERALSFGSAFGNSLVLSSQICMTVEGANQLARPLTKVVGRGIAGARGMYFEEGADARALLQRNLDILNGEKVKAAYSTIGPGVKPAHIVREHAPSGIVTHEIRLQGDPVTGTPYSRAEAMHELNHAFAADRPFTHFTKIRSFLPELEATLAMQAVGPEAGVPSDFLRIIRQAFILAYHD